MWTEIESIGKIVCFHPDIGILLDYSGRYGVGLFVAPHEIILDAMDVAKQTGTFALFNFFGINVAIGPETTLDAFYKGFAGVFTFCVV